MFSLVNSSSSSSKISEHKADDKDSDRLPHQEANPAVIFEPHTTKFSIRDHVLASRSKNISASWPFPRHLLQIFLKKGIRDLLPPFEQPSSTKSAHSIIKPASEKIAASSVQLEQTVLELDGSDGVRLLSKWQKLNNFDNDVCGVEKFSSPTGEPVVLKKCRIIHKAGAISEACREEEFISSPSMGSDIMASKICPVCKAFSSTSNTTLNAHMDQCLSMDSDATLGVENFHKMKAIKPRKKKLMVDIYATAQFCTLEDLDRRNGTTWATDLNPAAPNAESNLEARKPNLTESAVSRDDKSEGAVYVDSNGIKIGILSKINDASNPRELFRSRNNIETVRDGNISFSKENYTTLSSKKMKFKMRNKKLRSLKQFKNEVQAATEVPHHEQSHILEEWSPAPFSGELDKSLSCGSATLKSWPSSRRSDLSKKSGKKSFHKISERLNSALDTPSSARKSHTIEFSRVLESETANFPSNTVQNMEKKKRSPQTLPPSDCTPPNVILLKLSTVSGSVTSFPGSVNEEFFKESKRKCYASSKSHKRSAETCYLPSKTKKISTLGVRNSGSLKTGKHRSSLAWTDAQARTNETQFHQKMNSETLTGASSHNTDVNSILQKLSSVEGRDSQMDRNDKTSALMTIESMKQADKLTQDKLENRAKATSAQEFSVCLTSHDELALDIPSKNFLVDKDHLLPNQSNNFAGSQEPLVLLSPTSSASTFSPASPKDYHSKVLKNEPASNSSMSQVNLGFPFQLTVSKEGREMDIETNQQAAKPCCCSWQNIMDGNMKQKPLSNLHIRPTISSFYAYSNSRTDTSIAPSMESPTDSVLTKAFSDVGSTSPSCGTPTQSSSNSILRLMGKDLMVINNEESTQIPKVHSPNVHGPPSFGFASYASAPNHGAFSFPIHNQSPSMFGSQDRSLLPCFHQSMNKKPFFTKEVIVINDSDEAATPRYTVTSSRAMFQSAFSYFPTPTHLLPMDDGIRTSIPINQVGSFPASHLPSPFVFQSPSTAHLNFPFYYPQSLR